MTVFGKPFTTQVSQNPMMVSDQSVPEVGKPDRADTAKRASDDLKQSDAKRHRPGETLEPQENHQKGNQSSGGEYEDGFPPKGVASMVLGFLSLVRRNENGSEGFITEWDIQTLINLHVS